MPLKLTGGWLRWLAVGLLTIAAWGVAPFSLLGGLSLSLLVLTALKLREAKQRREYRLVCLLQLVTAGLLGAQQAALGSSLLQGLAVLVALAGLLQLELGGITNLGTLLRRSGQLVLAALPMALVLFLLFPRLGPFTNLGGLGQFGAAATTGLTEKFRRWGSDHSQNEQKSGRPDPASGDHEKVVECPEQAGNRSRVDQFQRLRILPRISEPEHFELALALVRIKTLISRATNQP